MRWRRMVGLGLPVAVLLVFLPAVRGGWLTLDDDVYLTRNPLVQGGLRADGVLWALQSTRGSLWIPLAWLSHMLDVSLWGMAPAGHHLTNVVLHALCVGVLYAVLLRLTGAPGRAAAVAALWGLHPLRVESVAWVTERKDLLCALFTFLTLEAYRRWAADPRPRRYLALTGAYALALAAKPMAVTVPALLLLLDAWPLCRGGRSLHARVVEKLPLLAMAAAVAVLHVAIGSARQPEAALFPLGDRLGNAAVSCVRYLGLMVWPHDLAVFYPFPPPWPPAVVAAALAALAAASGGVLALRRRAPYLLVGWAWYLVALLPVLGIVQAGSQGMADRFTLLPMVGLLVAVVWGVAAVAERTRLGTLAAAAACGAAAGMLAVGTLRQLAYWRDGESLYRHTLAVTRENWLIEHNLGDVLLRRGAAAEAAAHFARALAIEPRYAHAAFGLGGAYAALGRLADAAAAYRHAIAIDPTLAVAHNNLGGVLLVEGARDEAIGHFATALRLDPSLASARHNFVRELERSGVPRERIESYVRMATARAGPTDAR